MRLRMGFELRVFDFYKLTISVVAYDKQRMPVKSEKRTYFIFNERNQ